MQFSAKTTDFRLIAAASLFLIVFDNATFFHRVAEVFPPTPSNLGFLVSLAVGLVAFTILILSLLSSRYTTKPLLIVIMLVSSVAAYFMDHYSIAIDHHMVENVFETDMQEAADLFSPGLLLYFLLAGVLPSVFIYRARVNYGPLKKGALDKLKVVVISFLVTVVMILAFGRFYTSFFREHKPLRYYVNPLHYMYSTARYFGERFDRHSLELRRIGEDATVTAADGRRELVVLVVGEAARADHFSLNGYGRETNPQLETRDVFNFSSVYSSGTSTATSVPCMFSVYDRSDCDSEKESTTENLLDVLNRAGVNVLWRDNNSDSKGVAERVAYQDFKKPANNPDCDVECRDVGMLSGLQDYIDSHGNGDIVIVLHQMGNHGPAYYKRYPPEFERYTPVCRSNQLNECSQASIINAYDNALLYTDHFLSKVIDLLQHNSNRFETAMLYMSDHGESLGEGGLYLHGLPYFIAPESQKHVGAVMWFGKGFRLDRQALQARTDRTFSHDNLFHTVLGLLEVRTSVYDPERDILNFGGLERTAARN